MVFPIAPPYFPHTFIYSSISSAVLGNLSPKILLLIEEVGELAKAIRKNENKLGIDKTKECNYSSVESEVADVFIVLLSICDILNIDLFKVFLDKEEENIKRT